MSPVTLIEVDVDAVCAKAVQVEPELLEYSIV
jgi:hypothetical protein